MDKKANITYVNDKLDTKVDKTTLNTEMTNKVDKTTGDWHAQVCGHRETVGGGAGVARSAGQ